MNIDNLVHISIMYSEALFSRGIPEVVVVRESSGNLDVLCTHKAAHVSLGIEHDTDVCLQLGFLFVQVEPINEDVHIRVAAADESCTLVRLLVVRDRLRKVGWHVSVVGHAPIFLVSVLTRIEGSDESRSH